MKAIRGLGVGLMVVVFASACEREIVLRGDGFMTRLTEQRICVKPGDPNAGRIRCSKLANDTEIESSIEKGDMVSVRTIDGHTVSVHGFPTDE